MFPRKLAAAVTILLVALVTIALVASALPVFASSAAALPAHAQLVRTAPEDGASVPTAEKVTLTFSEDINAQFLQVRVEGPGGDETDGDPTVDGGVVTQPLTAALAAGEHRVTFRVVSVDGHPVSGTTTFTTTQAPASASPSPTDSPTAGATAAPTATPTATPTVTPSATASDLPGEPTSSGTPGWVVPAAIGALLALLAGGGVLIARGGRGTDDEHPTDEA